MNNLTKILLIEDNEAHAELISRAFENVSSEYKLTFCSNLDDARANIQSQPPDLIITDLNLPDGKGTELLKYNKEKDIPIILMTSFGDESIAVEVMKLGALDYIIKDPETFKKIPSTAERALRKWSYTKSEQQTQNALLQKELEQREILNSIVDGVVTIDEHNKILSFNHAAIELFGYQEDEIKGEIFNSLIFESNIDDDNYIKQHLTKKDQHGRTQATEVTALHKSGMSFPIRLSIVELSGKGAKAQHYIATCQDITFIKKQDEQIRRSQKMEALGKLTGGIAHDNNNILGIILGYADQINSHLDNPEKISKYSKNIMHAVARGSKLAKKLLAFSRQKLPDVIVTDINTILTEQKDMLQKTISNQHKLSLELDENLWLTELDSSDLEDAIVNICINAVHAMSSDGLLSITTLNQHFNSIEASTYGIVMGDYVVLNISDTGSGMDADTIEKIFDPFYSTKGEQGTGLGLSQVYGFMERSGGTIKVYSELGKGSRFAMYFPRTHLTVSEPSLDSIVNTLNISGTETLLIVDDEPDMVELAYDLFTDHGYKVLTANDGQQAIDILKQGSVDLIISDVIMPNVDGYQLAAHVIKNYPKVKLQMVSGFADERHKDLVDKKLHENMLYKPYNSDKLLLRARILLDENGLRNKIKPESRNLKSESFPKRKILILDDDEDVLDLSAINLKKLGYLVITVTNSEEAIKQYSLAYKTESPIDVVIVDLSIPGNIGGVEVAKRIIEINSKARIIVASGNTEGPEMKSPEQFGFIGALEKNFDISNIKNVLEKALEN